MEKKSAQDRAAEFYREQKREIEKVNEYVEGLKASGVLDPEKRKDFGNEEYADCSYTIRVLSMDELNQEKLDVYDNEPLVSKIARKDEMIKKLQEESLSKDKVIQKNLEKIRKLRGIVKSNKVDAANEIKRIKENADELIDEMDVKDGQHLQEKRTLLHQHSLAIHGKDFRITQLKSYRKCVNDHLQNVLEILDNPPRTVEDLMNEIRTEIGDALNAKPEEMPGSELLSLSNMSMSVNRKRKHDKST